MGGRAAGRDDDMRPVLVGQTGALTGTRWVLDREDVLIGRGGDCDIVVADRQVSRHHARVRRSAAGYVVEDLGSKNGTHLNGRAIQDAAMLQDGDVIQVALAAKLVYVGAEATQPLSLSDAAALGLGRLRIDRDAHRTWVGSVELDPGLSVPQFRLLELLYERAGHVVTREDVIEWVWPGTSADGVSDQAIDALVRRLRERLEEADPGQAYIATIRGHGFRLDNQV
jgi:DNA-binding response OmpR family regulator